MQKQRIEKALNSAEGTTQIAVALNVALGQDGAVPEWVELIPAGAVVAGIDGRSWINDRPQGIVDYFQLRKAHNRCLVFDWEHSTEHKAPKGEFSPAAAWGVEMEARAGGAIWAKVEWTPKGLESVTNRETRYLSPALIYEKATGRIVGINSVGLTNTPNFKLQALNSEGKTQPEETPVMKNLFIKLGLPESATETDALNAVAKLQGDLATATNRAETPSLDKFVPRSDYDAATQRATNAEQALATQNQAENDKAINSAIDQALAEGKITPASRDFYAKSCNSEGGLAAFQAFVQTAPVVAAPSNLDGKEAGPHAAALNADQAKIATMFGNSAEDLKKYGA